MKKLKVIDLFAGCGGFSKGFEEAGFENIFSNDIWEPAGQTFKHNHKLGKFILGDITNKNVKKEIVNNSRGCHVIVGGPPCQAYSMAGIRNVDDPRGKLIEDNLKKIIICHIHNLVLNSRI